MKSAPKSSANRAEKSTHASAPSKPAPGLYLVATPIGNLRDVTLRALDILATADLVLCEDTRVTGRLLRAYGIACDLQPYHEHNAARVRPAIMDRLARGAVVALVSDAGTPLVSDPGFKLVRECVDNGLAVVPVPGPSALLAALVASGLPTDRFLFAGFLPPRSASRRKTLAELAAVPATLVFYETGARLAASLADMAAALGDRPAAVAREMTKLHEEHTRGTLPELAARYADAAPPKGELVVAVGPPSDRPAGEDEVESALTEALRTMSVRDAATAVAEATGVPRKQAYAKALALVGKGGGN